MFRKRHEPTSEPPVTAHRTGKPIEPEYVSIYEHVDHTLLSRELAAIVAHYAGGCARVSTLLSPNRQVVRDVEPDGSVVYRVVASRDET